MVLEICCQQNRDLLSFLRGRLTTHRHGRDAPLLLKSLEMLKLPAERGYTNGIN